MSKTLVTGGLGYIGSHTVVELIQNNHDVIIIDNLSNSSIEVLKNIKSLTSVEPEFYNIDLKEKNIVYDFFSDQNITSVIHFAAFKAVGESVDNPIKYYENNIVSLINILNAIKLLKLEINFVFSSSCTVYGEADSLPVNEESRIKKAESPYGNTKQICEEILYDFYKSYSKIKAISLRYFNPIGAHPSHLIGELPVGPPQNLVPIITQTAAGLREKLIVFGNDYMTHDGTCVRDYIDINDLAKAHFLALTKMECSEKTFFENLNLGTGKPKSVMDIIKIFENISGIKLKYEIGCRRDGDVEAIYTSTIQANKSLIWEAKTDISESIKNAWLWQKKLVEDKK